MNALILPVNSFSLLLEIHLNPDVHTSNGEHSSTCEGGLVHMQHFCFGHKILCPLPTLLTLYKCNDCHVGGCWVDTFKRHFAMIMVFYLCVFKMEEM